MEIIPVQFQEQSFKNAFVIQKGAVLVWDKLTIEIKLAISKTSIKNGYISKYVNNKTSNRSW
jgi:hypothetical protein